MMKKTVLSLAGILLLLAGVVTADEKAWFDMENCEMCANFAPLMSTMVCEQHKISNGVLMVVSLADDQKEAYANANAACKALGEKMMNGYEAVLCGSCEKLGGLIAQGIVMEDVELQSGAVQLMTSDDEALVSGLHEWADRNEAEIAKMIESGELK